LSFRKFDAGQSNRSECLLFFNLYLKKEKGAMKERVLRTLGLPVVLSVLVLGAGCATSGDVDEVRKLAQDAKAAADQANRTATDASASAKEARDAAASAQAAAAAAQRAAEEAKMASQQTGEKVDRAFKKAVQK
jgi:type IV secretory pathway VirB6-like protein